MTKQINDVLKERNEKEKTKDEKTKTKKLFAGAKALARETFKAVEDIVPRAKALRNWLGETAALCAKKGEHFRWTTVLGMPVINCYHEAETKRVQTRLNGRRHRTKLVIGDKDEVWEEKSEDAAAANFVHSLDATHLQLVALAAAKEGIGLAVVHDCFGFLAPRAKRGNEILRETFVHLHKRHNLLAMVWSSARSILPKRVQLPELPETGNLEIEEILKSFFAFKS